jgi:hypothetical protein
MGQCVPVKWSSSAYDTSLYISTTSQPTQTAGPLTRPTNTILTTVVWYGSATATAPSETIVGTEGTTGQEDLYRSPNSIMT